MTSPDLDAGTTRPPYAPEQLERLVNPRSVAVVGASPTTGSFGERTLRNLARFAGPVYAVNPKYRAIGDVPCFPALKELPEAPDCVVLSVAAPLVEAVLREAAECGIGGAVVYASGFAETGKPDMVAAQARLGALAAASGLRIIGPNCIGLINVRSAAGLSFVPGLDEMAIADGPVAVVSQSGGLGYSLFQAVARGTGFSHYLTTGNSCDVDVADLINYLVDDPGVKAIACLFEGVRDGRRLLAAARRALEADKPVIACKIGLTERSRQVALSHTASVIGDREAYRAAFDKHGVIMVEDMEALLESAAFFARAGRPKARGVAALTTSGGASVMIADKADAVGVTLPPPTPETKAVLDRYVPAFGSTANPADVTAEALRLEGAFEACADAMLAQADYGALIFPLQVAYEPMAAQRAETLEALALKHGKPIAVLWLSEWLEGPGSRLFDASGRLAVFRSVRRCLTAIAAWHRRDDALRRVAAPARRASDPAAAERARALLGDGETAQILAAYGIATTGDRPAGGSELIARVRHDDQFGPLIAVGPRGGLVNRASALCPVGREEALALLHVLDGLCGADLDSLADMVCRLSELAADLADAIAGIEADPVIVLPDGVAVGDAAIVRRT